MIKRSTILSKGAGFPALFLKIKSILKNAFYFYYYAPSLNNSVAIVVAATTTTIPTITGMNVFL